jgi:cell division protein FtsB
MRLRGAGVRVLGGLLVVLLLGLQARLWLGEGGLRDLWSLDARIAEQRAENQRLRERNARLLAEVRDLREGLDAIEERARYDLGMVRPGETFFLVVGGRR